MPSNDRECPFCTAKKVVFVPSGERDGSGWMMCDECHATGPMGKNEEHARKLWNWGVPLTDTQEDESDQ